MDFPSGDIPEKFIGDPYRFLMVADKFQTGYDEPLVAYNVRRQATFWNKGSSNPFQA